jgi:hypothetical protein
MPVSFFGDTDVGKFKPVITKITGFKNFMEILHRIIFARYYEKKRKVFYYFYIRRPVGNGCIFH